MRLTEFVIACRKRFADEGTRYWTDVEIVRELNFHMRSIWREKASAHESYGLQYVDLSASDDAERWQQLDTDEFLWHLPSWVYRVHGVRRRTALVTTSEVPLQTGNGLSGWSFGGANALLVKGDTTAFDMRLKVQKLPALMIRGTFAVKASDLAQIVVPAELPIEASLPEPAAPVVERIPTDFEKGAMIGARIEITSSSATYDPRGVIATVRAQERLYESSTAAYQNYLTVIPRFGAFVNAGDSFESHAELDDVDNLLLILRTVNACHNRDNNLPAKMAMRDDLAREELRFTNSLAPREGSQPHFMETEDGAGGFLRRDDERDQTLIY